MGDAGDELPDGRQLLRLDELILQAPALRLVIEEQDQGRAVGAGNRHRGNGIGPIAGPELRLAARSLLIQGPLQIGRPLRRNEGLPRPADQAGGWRVDQVGKGAVGPADSSATIHDADGGRDRIDHLLPRPAPVVMQVHQPGALQRDAGLADEALQQQQ